MPGRMPEDMPDRMPDRMPENMSDRMPEDLPVTKCINVMVGITRSKVIFMVVRFDPLNWMLKLAITGHGSVPAGHGGFILPLKGACNRDDHVWLYNRYTWCMNIIVLDIYIYIYYKYQIDNMCIYIYIYMVGDWILTHSPHPNCFG